MRLSAESTEKAFFRCNICNNQSEFKTDLSHREVVDCQYCGSTPRFRGLMYALSVGLFGKSMCILDFPEDKTVTGIGMSEWGGYAIKLAEKFSFQNTFFHTEPLLDLTNDNIERFSNLDFVICSEVFEHIVPPLYGPFLNLRRLLKPNGLLIFSVPYVNSEATLEHFPELFDYEVVSFRGQWIVVNKDRSGQWTIHERPIFHGGPGTVLEMRLFSERDVLFHLKGAGFINIKIHDQPVIDIGYFWAPVAERAESPHVGLGYLITANAGPVT